MTGQKNNGMMIAIAAILVVASIAGGFFFMKNSEKSGAMGEEQKAAETAPEQNNDPANVETAAGDAKDEVATPANLNAGDFKIEEGNPVVAKVNGKEITRTDVYRFIQTMPPNIQQMPATTVYPLAMEQVINTQIVQGMVDNTDIENSQEFQREMEIQKQLIARNLYVQKQVDSKINEGKLKDMYKEAMKKIPDVEERRARHILLETEDKAKAAIDKLKAGGKFEELAKTLSIGPTAPKGGDLGYFAKQEMVPEFAEAAFSMSKGAVSENPVQSQFGWHVIELVDVRQRPKPTFEQLKPMLQTDARREILEGLLQEWRKNAKIEQFDINGKPLKEGANVIGIMPEQPNQPKQDG